MIFILAPLMTIGGLIYWFWTFKKDKVLFLRSVAFAFAQVSVGAWSIFQSRSSTAGIGFIFLIPLVAFSTFLFLALGQLTRTQKPISQTARRLALICWVTTSLALPGIYFYWGTQEIKKNKARDEQQKVLSEYFRKQQIEIADQIHQHKDNLDEWLKQNIEDAKGDSGRLSALAERPELKSAHLDQLLLVREQFSSWLLARSPHATPDQFQRMFDGATEYDYIFVELSNNPKTPVEILRKLFLKRSVNYGIREGLLKNPNTPNELIEILKTESK